MTENQPVQPTAQVPPTVRDAALSQRLGEHVASFPQVEPRSFRAYLIAAIICVVLAPLGLWWTFGRGHLMGASLVLVVVSALLSLAALGLWGNVLGRLPRRGRWLHVFEEGLVPSRRDTVAEVVPFAGRDLVEKVTHIHRQNSYARTEIIVQLWQGGQRVWRMPGELAPRAQNAVAAASARVRLPELLEVLNRGEHLDFGTATLTRTGISTQGQAEVPWGALRSLSVTRGRWQLATQGEGEPLTGMVNDTLNYRAMVGLMRLCAPQMAV